MFVRAFYPVLVRPEQSHAEEVNDLVRLGNRCSVAVYLTVFAAVFRGVRAGILRQTYGD